MPTITLIDEVNALIGGLDKKELLTLSDEYSYYTPQFRFNPSYKMGRWDGKIRLFSKSGRSFVRLAEDIYKSIKTLGYNDKDIKIVDKRAPLSDAVRNIPVSVDVNVFADHFWDEEKTKPIILRDYQKVAVDNILENMGGVFEVATGGGKTLIIAAISKMVGTAGKVVVIVPNVDLIIQTYGTLSKCGIDVGMWYANSKDKRQVTITTWQSLDNQREELLADAVGVIVDECHGASAPVLADIIAKNCTHVPIIIGCTGSIPDNILSKMQIKSLLGPVVFSKAAWELQNDGTLADTFITQIRMNDSMIYYDEDDFPDWRYEIMSRFNDEQRFDKIVSLITEIRNRHGNTLVLIPYVDIIDRFMEKFDGAHRADGKVKPAERAKTFKKVNEMDDQIVFATYHTAAVGIDIPRLFSVVMIEPGKSFTRVIQTIGRGIRKSHDKDHAYIYDLTSNKNLAAKQAKTRIQYYKRERHKYEIQEIDYK